MVDTYWLTTILGLHITIYNTELALLSRLLEVMHMGIVYGEALRLIVVWHVRSPARGWSRGVTWSWRVAPELGSLRIRWGWMLRVNILLTFFVRWWWTSLRRYWRSEENSEKKNESCINVISIDSLQHHHFYQNQLFVFLPACNRANENKSGIVSLLTLPGNP